MAAEDVLAGLQCVTDAGYAKARGAFRMFLIDEDSTSLNLNGCEIITLPSAFFASEEARARLQRLDCCDNRLTEFPNTICDCAVLVIISCNHNPLMTLPIVLGGCMALKFIYLWDNPLIDLPEDLEHPGEKCRPADLPVQLRIRWEETLASRRVKAAR